MEDGGAGDIMRYSFLRVFADDGTIGEEELVSMQRLALRDGQVDDDERRVLSGIFSRVAEEDVSPAVWREIVRFKEEHGIG